MLYNTYRNYIRPKANNDCESDNENPESEDTVTVDQTNNVEESVGIQDKLWLKFHTSPKDEVVKLWNSTFKLRRNEILNNCDKDSEEIRATHIFEEWPILSKSYGHLYVGIQKNIPIYHNFNFYTFFKVEYDFKQLHEDKTNNLFLNWKSAKTPLLKMLNNNIKDKKYFDVYRKAMNYVTEGKGV